MATAGPERTTPWSLPQSLEVTLVAHSREPRGHGGAAGRAAPSADLLVGGQPPSLERSSLRHSSRGLVNAKESSKETGAEGAAVGSVEITHLKCSARCHAHHKQGVR